MGGTQAHPSLTEDLLEDYTSLTYLSKGEILYLMKKFKSIDPDKVLSDYHHRFSKEKIFEKFDVLRNNPFKDRIIRVFSSKSDECFSFEDMLDLCSVMSADCPPEVKATWAFRIYDLDEDNQISAQDICEIIDRLLDKTNAQNKLDDDSKAKISKTVLVTFSRCVWKDGIERYTYVNNNLLLNLRGGGVPYAVFYSFLLEVLP